MDITGTLGVKEAGCGRRIGHLIGGTGQRGATAELSLSAFHIALSDSGSKTWLRSLGASAPASRI